MTMFEPGKCVEGLRVAKAHVANATQLIVPAGLGHYYEEAAEEVGLKVVESVLCPPGAVYVMTDLDHLTEDILRTSSKRR